MWISRHDQIDFMIYLNQGNVSIVWIYLIYYYLIFAMLIGGAPIPEETMVPVYYLLGRYPHVLIGIVLSYCLSFLISLMELGNYIYDANRIADTYFLFFTFILITYVLVNQENMKITRKQLDNAALKMAVVDLL
jgi:hypothetical protein